MEDRQTQESLSNLREQWGVQAWCDELLRWGCPSLDANEEDRIWFANWLRVGASPRGRLRAQPGGL
jgi:hypothetical protein